MIVCKGAIRNKKSARPELLYKGIIIIIIYSVKGLSAAVSIEDYMSNIRPKICG